MGDGANGFDPRFSPQFQPGFDARVHREEPSTVTREPVTNRAADSLITRPARRAQDSSGTDTGDDPDPAATDTPAGAASASASPAAASRSNAADSATDEHEPQAWWRRVNPYLVALAVVGVGLIGASVGWMAWVYSLANGQYSQFDYIIVQFAMFGAPIMCAVGVATLVSILVILAVRWRR